MGEVKTARGDVVRDGNVVWPEKCPKCRKALIETGTERICISCGQSWLRPVAETKNEV